MGNVTAADLDRVSNFSQLVDLLRDKLEWPIGEDYGFDDVVFEYEASELGLKKDEVAKIREIHQLRPLATHQPWGIFFISMEDKALPVTVLRRILKALIVKKRAGTGDRRAWDKSDLIFAASFGKSGARELAFIHFSDGKATGDLPVMKVLGWNARDTVLKHEYVASTLCNKLAWPDDPEDVEGWRKAWASAFELRLNETIRTSKDLAVRLAELASDIRARVNQLLKAEDQTGPMTTMLAAFRKNLIHDLDEDGFADMFAQTIAYGMLAARISRPMGIIADNLADMVPKTNPFLKELFGNFLKIGGRDKRRELDFDELGVRDVVDVLNNANMEAVLRDFGDRNPKEDPVIHFYELFLKEYDPKKRMQRGVFYTPRPVVNFIVRGVDEILRTEFGLPLGLADTSTWVEVAARNARITIPAHVKPDAPFVQILDPATGTGTFLVEVIDLIHQRMEGHWQAQGKSAAEIKAAWNTYVPAHLLPRLTAFELMMAPYTIAHMKVGLKLSETGYTFGSDERARILLTNALEPPRDLDMEFSFMSEALAHEAQAANDAKSALFTIVIGNPPYSPSISEPPKILELLDDWKKDLNETKSDLNREEWKFLRMATNLLKVSSVGCLGIIVNRDYLDGITKRVLRKWLSENFPRQTHIDLNGDVKGNISDENVFEIQQGVAVCLVSSLNGGAEYCSLVGTREQKYEKLLGQKVELPNLNKIVPMPPFYRISAATHNAVVEQEYFAFFSIPSAFSNYSSGIQTKCDALSVHFSENEIWTTVNDLSKMKPEDARTHFGLGKDGRDWTVKGAISDLNSPIPDKRFCAPIQYKPFDTRWTYWTGKTKGFLAYPRREIMSHIVGLDNLGLIFNRQVVGEFSHFFVSDIATNHGTFYLGNKGQDYIAPLWLIEKNAGSRSSNILPEFSRSISNNIALNQVNDDRGDLKGNYGPRDLFDYIYAVLHSPGYRSRYAEFLKSDFPRIPTPKDRAIFSALVPLGRALVALHLLRSEDALALKSPDIRFAGTGEARVEKGYPEYQNGKVMINGSRWFEDVPMATWEFHVGGYQVCEKWLKVRAAKGGKKPSPGRVLTEEDILHYRRVVVALTETRRLMAEIDTVIGQHGGWPGAFVSASSGAVEAAQ